MCVCERERGRERERERERINDADGVAYVADAANADDVVVVARDASADVDHDVVANDDALDVGAALAADPIIDVAWCAAPPHAHKKCSRSRSFNHFGKKSPRMHCPFRSSNSFHLNPYVI